MNHLLFTKKKVRKEDVMGYYCPGCDTTCSGGCATTCRGGCDANCTGGCDRGCKGGAIGSYDLVL